MAADHLIMACTARRGAIGSSAAEKGGTSDADSDHKSGSELDDEADESDENDPAKIAKRAKIDVLWQNLNKDKKAANGASVASSSAVAATSSAAAGAKSRPVSNMSLAALCKPVQQTKKSNTDNLWMKSLGLKPAVKTTEVSVPSVTSCGFATGGRV